MAANLLRTPPAQQRGKYGLMSAFAHIASNPVMAMIRVPLALTCVSALVVIGVFAFDRNAAPFSGQLALGLVSVLILAYLFTNLASVGVELSRRLTLIRRLTAMSNPRVGFDTLVRESMRLLCRHFAAERCTLMLAEPQRQYRLYQYLPGKDPTFVAASVPREAAARLLSLREDLAVAYTRHSRRWTRRARYFAYDLACNRQVRVGKEESAEVAEELGCDGFMAAPMHRGNRFKGRLIVAAKHRSFNSADAHFLCHVTEQIAPGLENVRLLDQLAAEAAEHERHQIGRDLHDSAIQPYIGLKFGLEALSRKARRDDPLRQDIERLTEMVTQELAEMRQLVRGLRSSANRPSLALEPAIRRQAARFGKLFGIEVTIDYACDLRLSEPSVAEALHAVSEALSNIRRHTRADRAAIRIACEAGWLILRVRNPHYPLHPPKPFLPRSLSERAQALGGRVEIEISEGWTTLSVGFPI